jgi:hypothetical protein
VSRSEKISVYNKNYHVGIIHCGKIAYLIFDPDSIEWVVSDEEGRQLSRKRSEEFSRENIVAFRVTHRRKQMNSDRQNFLS